MSATLLAIALAQAAPADVPPPNLLFGFYRIIAFHQRAKDLGCERAGLDAEFDAIRNRLIDRYGKKPFSPPAPSNSGPGDCGAVISVYRLNLAEYRKSVDAALQPAPGMSPKE